MNLKSCIHILIASVVLFLSACTPKEYELGAIDLAPGDLKPGTAFSIEADASNPNIIYFKSLLDPKYCPLWNHPQGRSQERTVALTIPFPGTYRVQFGAQTRGGIVYGEPVSFEITTFSEESISDPFWALLAGGVNKEKTWYLDLDADGVSRYFAGPMYYYGTDDWWGNVSSDLPALGDDTWNWCPDYPGNTWLMPTGDYGSMTFDLKGNANVTIEHKMIAGRGTETGTFLINTDNKTLTLSNAGILHDLDKENIIIGGWKECRILSLTEDAMQLAVQRDPVTSGEGPCQLVYNFISKDYFDKWNEENK